MKRSEPFKFVNQNAKKPKLQLEQEDDVWGDDPEIDEVEKCIELASQICSQSNGPANLTLVSYDDFKPNTNAYTSTQMFAHPPRPSTSNFNRPPPPGPSTSNFNRDRELPDVSATLNQSTIIQKDVTPMEFQQDLLQRIKHLEQQNKKLTEVYETKDGEISILRSQLKQAQTAVDNERIQKLKILEENQEKWNMKLHTSNKDVTCLKSELNLKTLEISNLRDKLAQAKKIMTSSLNMSIFAKEMNLTQTQNISIRKEQTYQKSVQTTSEPTTTPLHTQSIYPLHTLIPNTIFEKCQQENSTIQLKSFQESSCAPFRHNFSMTQCDNVVFVNPSISVQNKQVYSVTYLYPEISQIMKYSVEELNSEVSVQCVGKIVSFTRELLLCLLNKLKEIDKDTTCDDIDKMNSFYLQNTNSSRLDCCIFSGIPWCENEAAIDVRRCLAIVAALSLNCVMVTKYITAIENGPNPFSLLFKKSTPQEESHAFLNILLEITTIIENIRRSNQFSGLLAAIIKLLSNSLHQEIFDSILYDKLDINLIESIFRKVVFSRPNKPVLKYISEFLKTVSYNYDFIQLLCKLPTDETVQNKDGIMYFTEDTCTFQIVATELQACEIDIEMASNLIQFLNNIMSCNVKWMYYQETISCDCLVKAYSLAIEILYNSLEDYLSKNLEIIDKTILQSYYTIFRVGLIFLNIITIRIPDLVVRRSELYSQYQTIIKNINTIQNDLQLETGHETVLENLICKLNIEILRETKDSPPMESLFNSTFQF